MCSTVASLSAFKSFEHQNDNDAATFETVIPLGCLRRMHFNATPEAVMVQIVESPKENKAKGGVLFSER